MRPLAILASFALAQAACTPGSTAPAPTAPAPDTQPDPATLDIVVDNAAHELGSKSISATAEGRKLELAFEASGNKAENAIAIAHDSVTEPWKVRLNGQPVGYLRLGMAPGTSHLPVAKGALRDGDNQIAIAADGATQPIFVRNVRIVRKSLRQLEALGTVRVHVTDSDSKATLPSRLFIIDPQTSSAAQAFYPDPTVVTRLGIVYTMGNGASFQLPVGEYRVLASRGSEWSAARESLTVSKDETTDLRLAIRREVDTAGFIAADTHLHSSPGSGDSNAEIAERIMTLAGEGVEFAVATDHNHNTDYRPEQARLNMGQYFVTVTGNEVTTRIGHFNGFPLEPAGELPNRHLRDWAELVADIRAKGAKVVTLNHPRFPWVDYSPFADKDLNHLTGDGASTLKLTTIDAMELVNTNTLIDDPLLLVADWLALLNHGSTIKAVGVSDTHTVEAPPGQARTYVKSASDDPKAIDENEIYDGLTKGRSTVSLGIFVDVRLPGGQGLGDLIPVKKGKVELSVRIAAPSWVRPRSAHIFLNGQRVAEREVPTGEGEPTDITLPFSLSPPKHDAHVVCVVVGDAPSIPIWHPVKDYSLGATNPIYLDGDSDGTYSSPRATAQKRLARLGYDMSRVERALAGIDPVIAAQMLSLMRERLDSLIDKQAGRHKLAVPHPHTHIHHDKSEAQPEPSGQPSTNPGSQ